MKHQVKFSVSKEKQKVTTVSIDGMELVKSLSIKNPKPFVKVLNDVANMLAEGKLTNYEVGALREALFQINDYVRL